MSLLAGVHVSVTLLPDDDATRLLGAVSAAEPTARFPKMPAKQDPDPPAKQDARFTDVDAVMTPKAATGISVVRLVGAVGVPQLTSVMETASEEISAEIRRRMGTVLPEQTDNRMEARAGAPGGTHHKVECSVVTEEKLFYLLADFLLPAEDFVMRVVTHLRERKIALTISSHHS